MLTGPKTNGHGDQDLGPEDRPEPAGAGSYIWPDGHINRLFCAPEAAGQGIASRLYDVMEAAARQQGITSLFTEASELARRLFERKGFAVLERQNLVVRGVAIHNYRMAKALDRAGPGRFPASLTATGRSGE